MRDAIQDVLWQGRMCPLNAAGSRIIKRQNFRFSRVEPGAKERISLFLLLRATKTTLPVIK